MIWLNLEIAVLNSAEVKGSDPTERGTWLMLLKHCAEVENGGRIAGCRAWKCRRWQQTVAVTAKEVSSKCDLWHWDGNDLIVMFYPVDKEAEVIANRVNGAKGGRPRKAKQNHPVSNGKTKWFEIAETERKGIGKEGNKLHSAGAGEAGNPTQEPETPAHEVPTVEMCKVYAPNAPLPISQECAVAFHDTQQAEGWITRNGNPISDWRAAMRRYASRWNENEKTHPHRGGHAKTKAREGEYPQPALELP